MTKKQTTKTSKAKAPKEVKTPEEPVKKEETKTEETPKVDEEVKKVPEASNTDSGDIKNVSEGKDTQEEKEALKTKEIEQEQNPLIGMPYEQAEEEMKVGNLVALPDWEGFWFKQISDPEKTYVLTKEGKIVDTPHEKYKDSDAWQVVQANEEQDALLAEFWEKKNEEVQKAAGENYKKLISLKAEAYNRVKGTSFIKLSKKISYEDLKDRKNLPSDSSRDSEFILSDGSVFDLESSRVTNQNLSEKLKQLK